MMIRSIQEREKEERHQTKKYDQNLPMLDQKRRMRIMNPPYLDQKRANPVMNPPNLNQK